MKKILFIFFCFVSSFIFSQSKYTAEDVEKSNDPKVVANFIKYNPDHPRTPEFKSKLYRLIAGDSSSSSSSNSSSKSSSTTSRSTSYSGRSSSSSSSKTSSKSSSSSSDPDSQKTVDLLNHMFNTDPTSREVYVQIENKSKCNLVMKFSGRKSYTLTVPARNQNFILIDKGTYSLTSKVCNAPYAAKKSINKDLMIALNAPD